MRVKSGWIVFVGLFMIGVFAQHRVDFEEPEPLPEPKKLRPSPSVPSNELMEKLVSWAEQRGTYVHPLVTWSRPFIHGSGGHPLDMHTLSGGGVIWKSGTPPNAGEVFLDVAVTQVSLSDATVMTGPLSWIWQSEDLASGLKLAGVPPIVVGLMYETAKGGASDWAPWISTLPSITTAVTGESPMCPLAWNEDQLLGLQGTAVGVKIMAASKLLESSFDMAFSGFLSKYHPTVFPADVFTSERFKWAWCMVNAYGVASSAPSEIESILPHGRSITIVPLLSLFRTCETGPTVLLAGVMDPTAAGAERIQVIAADGVDWKLGSELCVAPNRDWSYDVSLKNQGRLVTVEPGPNDVVPFVLSWASDDPYREDKAAFLRKVGLDQSSEHVILPSGEVSKGLMAAVRVVVAGEGEMGRLDVARERPINDVNEAAALSSLVAGMEYVALSMEGAAGSSLEEDIEATKVNAEGIAQIRGSDFPVLRARVIERRLLASALEKVAAELAVVNQRLEAGEPEPVVKAVPHSAGDGVRRKRRRETPVHDEVEQTYGWD